MNKIKFEIRTEIHGNSMHYFLCIWHNEYQASSLQLPSIESIKELKRVVDQKLEELEDDDN